MDKIKKICGLVLIFSSLVIGLKSQNAIFQITNEDNGNSPVINNDVFNLFTSAGSTTAHDFELKNISSVTQTIAIRKSDILMNISPLPDTAKAYFCTGANCYEPDIINVSVVLAANEAMIFKADLDEASTAGQSEVSYKFSSSGQTIIFSLKYSATPVSVKSYAGFVSGVSNVYPNPSTSRSFITVNSIRSVANVNVTIINSLGSVVSSKEVVLINGKNTINLDTENYKTGIYFVTISNGASVTTKKITIINQ